MKLKEKVEVRSERKLKNFMLFCEEHGCDWKREVQPEEVHSWHNRPCPKCGKGIIVKDADIQEMDRLLRGETGAS